MNNKNLCSIEGCDNKVEARGWCAKHYQRWWKRGDPSIVLPNHPGTLEERFWAKVNKNGNPSPEKPELGPCWEWIGDLTTAGYGRITINVKSAMAHRVSYEWLVGEIPEGLDLDHLCRVRRCIKSIADEFGPAHLEPVTRKENNLRGVGKAAINAQKTHCPNGHPYDEENTYICKKGRQCRVCRTEASKKSKRKQRAMKKILQAENV